MIFFDFVENVIISTNFASHSPSIHKLRSFLTLYEHMFETYRPAPPTLVVRDSMIKVITLEIYYIWVIESSIFKVWCDVFIQLGFGYANDNWLTN